LWGNVIILVSTVVSAFAMHFIIRMIIKGRFPTRFFS
jgi:hypothetical protein